MFLAPPRSCDKKCDKVAQLMAKIPSPIPVQKATDKRVAKTQGITQFPAISYFKDGEATHYEGEMTEEALTALFVSLLSMDNPDRIEEIEASMLNKVVKETSHVAVLFCKNKMACNSQSSKCNA